MHLVHAAAGEVARDLGKADETALLIAQRRDHDIGPEARAVLAHAPALVLEPAFGRGHLELACGPVAPDVLGCVEGAEMLADDLLRAIALEPLGADVPGPDVPLGIEGEHRVVLRLLDEQTIDVLGKVGGVGGHAQPATHGGAPPAQPRMVRAPEG
jgi:hypothetical protein